MPSAGGAPLVTDARFSLSVTIAPDGSTSDAQPYGAWPRSSRESGGRMRTTT